MGHHKRRIATAGMLVTTLLVAGCGGVDSGSSKDASGGDGGAAKTNDGPLKIAVLQKQGDQQYFVDEANGAKAKAKELGNVEVSVADLGTDANKAISEVENAVARGVDGIAIVVPDAQIGPQVIDAARAAKIPIVAADDAIKDGQGKPAPFVGFDATSMGRQVGKKAGELFKKAGWTPQNTRIISSWQQDLQTCNDRVAGAKKAFQEETGGALPKIVELGTDNSATDAQDKAAASLTSNKSVEHWVVWGCNDENETGVVTALQNGGVASDDIIGVGLGAYLTCKDWQAGKSTGNKAALYIGGPAVGASAIDTLVTSIRTGKPLPAQTLAKTEMVDADTWKQSGLVCT
jgi:L-arabinose transport system substrate-binding protein